MFSGRGTCEKKEKKKRQGWIGIFSMDADGSSRSNTMFLSLLGNPAHTSLTFEGVLFVCPYKSDFKQKLTIGYQLPGARYRSTYQTWMFLLLLRRQVFARALLNFMTRLHEKRGHSNCGTFAIPEFSSLSFCSVAGNYAL